MEREGVIKYRANRLPGSISRSSFQADLFFWRSRLQKCGLIGIDAHGVGYGNLSVRLYASPRFLVTGSQTSGLTTFHAEHMAEIKRFNLDEHTLSYVGETPPSSEALTHAALYQCDTSIGCVVHVHAASLWRRFRGQLPTTGMHAAYGTPEMAYEMIRLYRRGFLGRQGVAVLGGHEDGLIAFGPSVAVAASCILNLKE